jgi:uncharacterized Fe-S cluster-containing protein
MKAIFINARERKVEEITLEKGIENIYKVIGYGCELFTVPSILDNQDGLFIDDEGVFEGHSHDDESDESFGFAWDVSPEAGTFDKYFPICGNGVLIGCDDEGESVDVKTTLEEVKKRVKFVPSHVIEQYKNQFI